MKKFVIVLVIIVVMLGGVGVGVYLVQQSTKLKSEAAPSTTLSFSASTLTPRVGDEIIVTSSVNTGENNIVVVQMRNPIANCKNILCCRKLLVCIQQM